MRHKYCQAICGKSSKLICKSNVMCNKIPCCLVFLSESSFVSDVISCFQDQLQSFCQIGTKSNQSLFMIGFRPLKYRALSLLANCLLVLLGNKKQKSHRATSKTPTHAASAAAHWDIKALCHVCAIYVTRVCDNQLGFLLLKFKRKKIRHQKDIPILTQSFFEFVSSFPNSCRTVKKKTFCVNAA